MDAPEIVTQGTGREERTADRAELGVTFVGRGRDRPAAVTELGRRVTAAEGALSGQALTVRHRRLWVSNEWRGDRVTGCTAREDLALVVTDVTALAELLGALVATQPADLHGPRWLLDDPSAALREAQRRAVADARERAEGYAAALGGRLGPLRRLTDAAEHAGRGAYRLAAADAETAPDVRDLGLEPEPVEVTAHCTASWTLLP